MNENTDRGLDRMRRWKNKTVFLYNRHVSIRYALWLFRDPSKKCSNNGWKSRGSSLVSPFYGAGSVIVLSAYFWAKCVHLWCSKGSLKSGHPLKSALEVTNIIIWGRKRFIRLRPLDYHTARTQEIVKGGGAVYLNPLLYFVDLLIHKICFSSPWYVPICLLE